MALTEIHNCLEGSKYAISECSALNLPRREQLEKRGQREAKDWRMGRNGVEHSFQDKIGTINTTL